MNDAARNGSEYQMRRSVPTCQRMRIDSANDGGISSVPMTASLAPAAARSQWPRPGSLQPQAQDHEHERRDREDEERDAASRRSAPSRPPTTGPTNAPIASADRVEPEHVGAHFGRVVVGRAASCASA